VSEQDRNKAWGFTLFGDDLRAEVGGKMSLMGLYQADMFFPDSVTFPASIPRFFLLIMYYEKKGTITEDITFKVTFGTDELVLIEFPILRKDIDAPTTDEPNPTDTTPEDTERIFHSRIPVMLSPFTIPTVGRLRIRAHYSDGCILKLGSISVRQTSVEEFNKMVGAPQAVPSQN
jgi:hypothetical protein